MFSTCAVCGMKVIPGEYHPYTACVLYKHTRQAEKVESLLREVVLYGYKAAKKGIDLDDALHNIAASNTALSRPNEAGAVISNLEVGGQWTVEACRADHAALQRMRHCPNFCPSCGERLHSR